MNRRAFITLIGGAVAWPLDALAQPSEQTRRIGFLLGGSPSDRMRQAWLAAFRQGLQERGWPEGQNIRIDYRWSGTETGAFRAWAARIDYNTNRPHSSLNGLTPIEFAARPDQGHNRNRLYL